MSRIRLCRGIAKVKKRGNKVMVDRGCIIEDNGRYEKIIDS